MQPQSKISQSFRRALLTYQDAATVQRECADRLAQHLFSCELPKEFNRGFEFGCGTGFLTKQLINTLSIKALFVNDLVASCKDFLLESGIPPNQFSFIEGDIEAISIPNSCDLICSTSCIQWSTDQATLIEKLSNSLNKNGYLAISSFSQGHFKELQNIQTEIANHRYALNYWTTKEWEKHLKVDFNIKIVETEQIVLWFNSVNELLLHLRHTGVNGNVGQNWSQHTLKQFRQRYREEFEQRNKVPLSYQPIYIVAQKKDQ